MELQDKIYSHKHFHWVPHLHSLVPYLSKKLIKLPSQSFLTSKHFIF